jgi:hypothetical protein
MNQNLMIVRCGRNTLHWQWFEGGERNWDLLLCPFEEIDARGLPSIYIPGQKWDGLYHLLHTNSDWRKYEYICLPDDDIAADAMTWNTFFDYCHYLHAELAAPALTPNSFFFHLDTMQNTSFTARASTFVEIMNPCMSSAFLERAYPTMNLSRSGAGWGLDFLWSLMLSYKDMWIIDETPVRHTKPVGGARDSLVAELACDDQCFISGMGVPFVSRSIGGFTHDGEFVSYEDSRFAQLYRNGFDHVEQYHPNRWEDVQRLAAGPPPDADPQALTPRAPRRSWSGRYF